MKWSISVLVILLAIVSLVEVFGAVSSSFLGAVGASSELYVVPGQFADLGYKAYDIILKNVLLTNPKDTKTPPPVAFTLYNRFPVTIIVNQISANSKDITFPVDTTLTLQPIIIPPFTQADVYISALGIDEGVYTVTYVVSVTNQDLAAYVIFTGTVTVETPPPPEPE
jgi:hypothetical protein